MTQMNLDLSKASVASAFTTVPSGIYSAKVISATPKETAKKGFYLEIGFKILDGDHAGKVVADRLNIVNANPDTQSWALNNLKTILTAGGHKNPNFLKDTDELLGLEIKASIEASQGEYDGKTVTNNNFKGYFKLDKSAPSPVSTPVSAPVSAPVQETVSAPTPVSAPVSAPASEQKFPWS